MQAPLRKKSEMKILILYLMNQLRYPLDYETLHDVLTLDGLMSSFDFAECFAELLETGNVVEKRDESGADRYEISAQGRHVSEELKDVIMHSIRDRVYKTAMSYINFQLSGRRTECELSTDARGRDVVTCSVSDDAGDLMRVSAVLDSREKAEAFKKNWDNHPETVYRGILALLSGDADFIM